MKRPPMMARRSTVLAVSALIAVAVAPARGEVPASAPSTTAASEPSGPLMVTVTGVDGLVQVKVEEGQKWQPAKVGMVLGVGAEFRTGPKSAVRFVIPPDQTITLDRLGTVKVLTAIQTGGKVKTDLGMKYGRTRYDIEAAGLEHESTIRSPNSTLAIRGTQVTLTDQRPFPPEAISLTGTAQYSTAKRQMAVGGKGTGRAQASGDLTPAETALLDSVVDPQTAFARTPAETALIATVLSRGAVFSVDRNTGIPIVRGGVPPTDAQLLPTLPPGLNVVLRWNGDANLDLGVSAPAGNGGEFGSFFVFPAAGLNAAPNGAHIPFDHRGGPNGGIEIAEFPNPVQDGPYAAGAFYTTTNGLTGPTVQATFEAFLNGVPVSVLPSGTTSDTETLGPGQTAFVTATVGSSIPLPPGFGGGTFKLDAARGGSASPAPAHTATGAASNPPPRMANPHVLASMRRK